MSASNWAICPRCRARARLAADRQIAEVMATYGKVPVAEFDAARSAIGELHDSDFSTFRESYEIYGAQTGTVTVSYGGGCDVCGLSLSFTDERPIPDVTA